jgi:mannose-6-phosphate isomerase-like protein (cupin superfamily)
MNGGRHLPALQTAAMAILLPPLSSRPPLHTSGQQSRPSTMPSMEVHDVEASIRQLIGEGDCAFGSLNQCTVGIARFSAHPLWERHPNGDELLHVIEGRLDLTVLAEDGPVEMTLGPGQVLVVPQGLWHSPRPQGSVTLLFATPSEGTTVSDERPPVH